jgi:hypothetical protein
VASPRHRVLFVALAGALLTGSSVRPARAQVTELGAKDQPATPQPLAAKPAEGDKDPIRGSTFIFDQSITTPTADVGLVTPQSRVPLYELWFSLRPRWYFTDDLRVQARLDLTKELTNSEQTTNYREDVFGDIWTDLVYSKALAPPDSSSPWKHTKGMLAARLIWPTSKTSISQGIYLTAGARAGLTQDIPLRGESAPVLNSARVGLSFTYQHPFSNSTTPTNTLGFSYLSEDTDLRPFASEQLSGQTFVNHSLYGIVDLGLNVMPKLSATLDYLMINQWHYAPTSACVTIATGPACPPRNNDQQYTQMGWVLLSLDYEVIPEMSVGIGYYNLANAIAPDGTVRTFWGGGDHSLLWSPDARFFFDVPAHLDKIWERASGRYNSTTPQTVGPARTARQERIVNEIR